MNSQHALIISHDVVGTHMAGPGIRYWEMARVLARQQPVTLVAPHPIDLRTDNVVCGSYDWGNADSLAQWLRTADVVIANGHALHAHPELAQIVQSLVLDLYDPTLLENLELFRTAPDAERRAHNDRDVTLLQQQLAAGDFFLCATERQRDLYIGALMTAGRITPERVDTDPQLRNLIDVVSFGLPSEPPIKQHLVLRGVLPGIGIDDVVLLWTGGLWDWMDPLTLVQAMPQVVAEHPSVRLVFLAGSHPGNVHPMRMPQETRRLAESLGLLNHSVFFYEQWIPYFERADFLLEADIAISLHRNHLETAFAAVRSRFLDHLWAELPSVVSAGDAAAELVQQYNLGCVVPAEDTNAITLALNDLVDNPQRRHQCRQYIQQLKPMMSWQIRLGSLLTWLKTSTTSVKQRPAQCSITNSESNMEQTKSKTAHEQFERLTTLVRQAEQLWSLQPTPPLATDSFAQLIQMLRLYLQQASAPIYEQQTHFNAIVTHMLYWMSDEMQRRQQLEHNIQELMPKLEALTTAHHQTRMMVEELASAYHQTHCMLQDLLAEYQETRGAVDKMVLAHAETE